MTGSDAFRARPRGNGTAAATAILMVGLAVSVAWVLVAPMVLAPGSGGLHGPLPSTSAAPPAPAALVEGVRVAGVFQTSQPRDPFRPLIDPDAPTPVITPSDPTRPPTFTPTGTRITLVEIRDVNGVLRATVTVDGTSYDVGEGDTFAGKFKVVRLEEDKGVFLFGDNAFELSVGQAILK